MCKRAQGVGPGWAAGSLGVDDAAVVGLFPRRDGQPAIGERDVLGVPGDLRCRPEVAVRLRTPAPFSGPAEQNGVQHRDGQVTLWHPVPVSFEMLRGRRRPAPSTPAARHCSSALP